MERHLDEATPAARSAPGSTDGADRQSHSHSGWAMLACCIPMIVFFLAVAFGLFGR